MKKRKAECERSLYLLVRDCSFSCSCGKRKAPRARVCFDCLYVEFKRENS